MYAATLLAGYVFCREKHQNAFYFFHFISIFLKVQKIENWKSGWERFYFVLLRSISLK